MNSIYKLSTLAIVAAVSASLLPSVAGIASASEPTVTTSSAEAPASNSARAEISKRQAKQIVKDYLKNSGKGRLRVSSVHGQGEYWIVSVKTAAGLHAAKMKVHKNSGELSKA